MSSGKNAVTLCV